MNWWCRRYGRGKTVAESFLFHARFEQCPPQRRNKPILRFRLSVYYYGNSRIDNRKRIPGEASPLERCDRPGVEILEERLPCSPFVNPKFSEWPESDRTTVCRMSPLIVSSLGYDCKKLKKRSEGDTSAVRINRRHQHSILSSLFFSWPVFFFLFFVFSTEWQCLRRAERLLVARSIQTYRQIWQKCEEHADSSSDKNSSLSLCLIASESESTFWSALVTDEKTSQSGPPFVRWWLIVDV